METKSSNNTDKIPVLFIIFNRPDIAVSSFEAIREYKPDRLYIAADGPRESRPEEKELCQLTRDKILNMIDWECDVHTLFRDKNIGVDFGVYNAINWMFETEKYGVIIEDDCYVSQDFFYLCEDAFPKFEHEEKIVHIIANNPMAVVTESDKICFTYNVKCWGWGTWREKWGKIMDTEMKRFREFNLLKTIRKFGIFQGLMYKRAFSHAYHHKHKLQTWDTIWHFNVIQTNSLCLLPMVNLAINKGIGTCEGTHYHIGDENFYDGLQIGKLLKPYSYPQEIRLSQDTIKMEIAGYKRLKMFGLRKKLKRLFRIQSKKLNNLF